MLEVVTWMLGLRQAGMVPHIIVLSHIRWEHRHALRAVRSSAVKTINTPGICNFFLYIFRSNNVMDFQIKMWKTFLSDYPLLSRLANLLVLPKQQRWKEYINCKKFWGDYYFYDNCRNFRGSLANFYCQ